MVSDSNFVFYVKLFPFWMSQMPLKPSLLSTMTTTGVKKTKILEIFVNHDAIQKADDEQKQQEKYIKNPLVDPEL